MLVFYKTQNGTYLKICPQIVQIFDRFTENGYIILFRTYRVWINSNEPEFGKNIYWRYFKLSYTTFKTIFATKIKFFNVIPLAVDTLLPTSWPRFEGEHEVLFRKYFKAARRSHFDICHGFIAVSFLRAVFTRENMKRSFGARPSL